MNLVEFVLARFLTESGCEWPLGWKYSKSNFYEPGSGELVLCDRTPIGKDKNGIPYCRQHVPADHDKTEVPDEPDED